MESQRSGSPILSWAYFFHGKTMEELRSSLLYTTLELEQTRVAVQEELRKRDEQLIDLKELLNKAIEERDDALDKCQSLLLEKLLLQQQLQQQLQIQQQQNAAPLSGISSIEDEPRRCIDSNNGFSSSDCEESIVSSPVTRILPLPPPPPATQPMLRLPPEAAPTDTTLDHLVKESPLPEKGKLLQAVMKAGPLLQTLLLAGPLPQWRHPPPPLDSIEIPPVTVTIPSPPQPQALQQPQLLHHNSLINISGCNRKRVFSDISDHLSPTESKYQRVALH